MQPTNKYHRITLSLISTVIFAILAHSYRFYNNMFSGDSLMNIYQDDSAWQIALGRIGQPVYLMFRGSLCNPWLISFLAIIFTGLAVYITAEILDIRRPLMIVLISGLYECNIAVTCQNATYLPWVDIYALALLTAVLGIYLVKLTIISAHKRVYNVLLLFAAAFSLAISLSLYQAYICVAISLVMIVVMLDLQTEGSPYKRLITNLLSYCLIMLAAAAIYYITWKCLQRALNIWTADGYNGLASVGDYSGTSIGGLIALTYRKVLEYYSNPEVFTSLVFRNMSLSILWVWLIRVANVLAIVSVIYGYVSINRRNKTGIASRIMQLVILLLLPIGLNFICIISKGMVHSLMVYSYIMFYILAIKLMDSAGNSNDIRQMTHSVRGIIESAVVILFAGIFIWNNIVYANQVYLKKALQDQAASALMNRIVEDIEAMNDYVPGVTPVAIEGRFDMTDYISDIPGMENIRPYGMGETALLYPGTDYAYINYELSVAMNLTRLTDEQIALTADMPSYPANGSIEYVDGIVVVKVSEN